jgi:hypothetical protein
MRVRFIHQILIGTHVYGAGEVAHLDERTAVDLIHRGVAVETIEPSPPVVHVPPVREQTAEPTQARRAVKR